VGRHGARYFSLVHRLVHLNASLIVPPARIRYPLVFELAKSLLLGLVLDRIVPWGAILKLARRPARFWCTGTFWGGNIKCPYEASYANYLTCAPNSVNYVSFARSRHWLLLPLAWSYAFWRVRICLNLPSGSSESYGVPRMMAGKLILFLSAAALLQFFVSIGRS